MVLLACMWTSFPKITHVLRGQKNPAKPPNPFAVMASARTPWARTARSGAAVSALAPRPTLTDFSLVVLTALASCARGLSMNNIYISTSYEHTAPRFVSTGTVKVQCGLLRRCAASAGG